jgi:hypothetical protein
MNQGSKPSNHVFIYRAGAVIDAVLYSYCIGRKLNRFITIHFGKAGVRGSSEARRLLEDFLKHGGDWLSKRGLGPPCYVYVLENPQNGGLHAHVLLHVPREHWKPFAKFARGWIKRGVVSVGGKYQKGVLVDKPVLFCSEREARNASASDVIEKGLLGSLLYLLKGAEAGTLALLGLDEEAVARLPPKLRPSCQGFISGKREGFSNALSRQRHAFPSVEIRSGMWMAGREAHARAALKMFGLEFVAPSSREPGYRAQSRVSGRTA